MLDQYIPFCTEWLLAEDRGRACVHEQAFHCLQTISNTSFPAACHQRHLLRAKFAHLLCTQQLTVEPLANHSSLLDHAHYDGAAAAYSNTAEAEALAWMQKALRKKSSLLGFVPGYCDLKWECQDCWRGYWWDVILLVVH